MFELIPHDAPVGPGPALLALPAADSSLRSLIPEHLLERHRCLPLQVTDNVLVVALPQPYDKLAVDDIELITGLDVEAVTLPGFEACLCDVTARVSGPLALVEVVQTFVNHFTGTMEGVYTFPFSRAATLHSFSVAVGTGEPRKAKLLAVEEGDDRPPLVVSAERGVLRAELGPLPAAESVRVTFSWFERLDASLCETVLRLPAIPGMHAAIELETAGRPLSRLACSVPVERREASPGLWQLNAVTDHGCVLRFGFQGSQLAASLLVRDEHFLLTLTPPLQLARPAQPRDVTLVLDRSERMAGERWDLARRAVSRLLGALEPGDRLRVWLYNREVTAFKEGEALRPEDAAELERYLGDLTPWGPDTGLQRAVNLAWAAGDDGRQPFLVFIGSPGERCMAWTPPERRFLGIGHTAADQAFLAPFGPCAALNDQASLTLLVRELATPMLTDVRLVDRGLNYMTEGLEPSPMPDLSAARPLCITGWKLGHGPVEVRGTLPGGETWSQLVHPVASGNEAVRLAWAEERLRALEGSRGTSGELVRLSRHYGLPSSLTRFMLAGGGPPGSSADDRTYHVDDPPIVRVVNLIISQAINDRATHIHYEKVVRYRVDGVVHDVMNPPEFVRAPIVERLKALAGIEAVPGQGKCLVTHDGRGFELTVSVVPTSSGEKLTVRLAQSPPVAPPLPDPIQQLLGLEGLVLVSEDLLPACIEYHRGSERHVVVYGKGLEMGEGPTYLEGRTRLDLDTDVLISAGFCDEMLDVPRAVGGTASTDMMLTLMRLQGHKEVCARLRGIATERRLRKSCGCERGCERCRETGFFGEIALHEVLWVTDELRVALAGPLGALIAAARKAQLTTFVEQARQAAERGETTFAEVVRVFGADAHRGPEGGWR